MPHNLDHRQPIPSIVFDDRTIRSLHDHIAELIRLVTTGLLCEAKPCNQLLEPIQAILDSLFSDIQSLYPNLTSLKGSSITTSVANEFLGLESLLRSDIEAALINDPATNDPIEVILCYPGFKAITYHRIAHILYQQRIPLLPRMIAEISHQITGIDIHPGAQIGSHFFIDHGTGVVIGETTIIGERVTIYQGVTLGAKRFQRGQDGKVIKGQPRHPVIGDQVTIYSGATILGRITIGARSVIGGNVWLTDHVPPGSRITQQRYQTNYFIDGDGI